MSEWLKIRGHEGCEWVTSSGRCRRPVKGYIQDGNIDKHLCSDHWREYHDNLMPTSTTKRLTVAR